MDQILPVPPFQCGLPQPSCYPALGRKRCKSNYSVKQRPHVIASWKMRTLQDDGLGIRRRTSLITCDLARNNIDIAAISETRLPEEGSIVEVGTG